MGYIMRATLTNRLLRSHSYMDNRRFVYADATVTDCTTARLLHSTRICLFLLINLMFVNEDFCATLLYSRRQHYYTTLFN